jgi:exodeoxyribonuclease V beta subunit
MTSNGAVAAANWTDLALGDGGRSLIEASAGTGKTWAISVLYLRLLLEQRLGPAQIVVTTFTDAAAQELRERVRARIGWARRHAEAALADRAIENAEAVDDLRWLQARWRDEQDAVFDAARARADLNRLRLAQIDLDRAPIGTLHSLCRRILAEHPFESGSTFVLGNPVTPDAIHNQVIDDLWRQLSQSDGELDAGDALWRRAGRAELEKYLRLVLAPGVGVATIEPGPIDEVMRIENAQMLAGWVGNGAQFARSNDALRARVTELAKFIADGDRNAKLPDLSVLDEVLDKHLKAPAIGSAPTLRALALARRAADVLPMLTDQPRASALARYREQLQARCRERLAASGRMTFDELIERVNRGLAGGAGAALADRLFAVWPVALVDEFQDTDLQQYAILDRIYRETNGKARGRLVMIGDPKQAIYRFRGGDIDAYLQARTTADSTLALATNFRSSRQFVRALNAFYAQAGNALGSQADQPIAYRAVDDSSARDTRPYCIDGLICERPLQFHYWDGSAVPNAVAERVDAALEACANHVVELLSGAHTIGARTVQPGDIAVLLPTRDQVSRLRAALRERGVPSVASAWNIVFESAWARELRICLYAALHPRDAGAVRAALATRLGGRTFVELRDEHADIAAWQRDAETFEHYEILWRRRGVLALVQALAGAAAPRLFAAEDGERALTDLRHLGELLQAHSEEIAGREELLSWFADECERAIPEATEAASDERQQRIESDARRLRLMTLHASKGLEFNIVLLPLMWANRHNSMDKVAIVHDASGRQRLVTFGGAATRRYRQEGQDERFRLLYVALTRARYACHVYALSPQRPFSGRRADIDPDRAALDCMIERLLAGRTSAPSMDHVLWHAGRWSWPLADYRPTQAPPRKAAHVFAAPAPVPFEATWSFSALTQGLAGAAEETAAADEVAGPQTEGEDGEASLAAAAAAAAADSGVEPEQAQLAWLAPIAGADFGNALHAIFEQRAPGAPMHAQHALIERCLRTQGVGLRGIALDELVPHLAARVQATLDMPLLVGGPALGALPAHAFCAEMAFEFALGEVTLRRLRAVCDFVPATPQRTLRGLMTGRIDLVFEQVGRFHVLDYKSNRLGSGMHLSDYAEASLERAMSEDHYRFQALLYTVALDRHLRQRVPGYRRERHLGEAIYLFVRAVGIAPRAAPRAGIWTRRFDDALIDAVDVALAGNEGQAA